MTINETVIELVQGNITNQHVTAIVNAANDRLIPGNGVDAAIHKAAGTSLVKELEQKFPEGCPTGEAVATSGCALIAKYIFHAVGPIWRGGIEGEAKQLESAYTACMTLAVQHRCDSIAFPAISTGAYGFPIDQASQIALSAIVDFIKTTPNSPKEVRLVLFSEDLFSAFSHAIERLFQRE